MSASRPPPSPPRRGASSRRQRRVRRRRTATRSGPGAPPARRRDGRAPPPGPGRPATRRRTDEGRLGASWSAWWPGCRRGRRPTWRWSATSRRRRGTDHEQHDDDVYDDGPVDRRSTAAPSRGSVAGNINHINASLTTFKSVFVVNIDKVRIYAAAKCHSCRCCCRECRTKVHNKDKEKLWN